MAQPSIPLLDLSLASSPATKPLFLSQLRHALLEVGFLYLKNYGISPELTEAVIKEGVEFFELPLEEKYVFFFFLTPASFVSKHEMEAKSEQG